MEKVYRVKIENGKYRDFTNEDEANAYEAELKLKKEQELERQRKLEAERKAKEEQKNTLVKKIKQTSNELHTLLKQYEEQEGHSFTYYDKDFNDINLTRLINGLVNGLWCF